MPTSSSISSSDPADARPVAKGLFHCRNFLKNASIVRWTVFSLLVAELLVVLVAPLVVPPGVYLRLYLREDSRRSMRSMRDGATSYLVWDQLNGWRNRPNTGHGQWQVGPDGARTTVDGMNRTSAKQVWFFGDSMVNGGTSVTGNETISAHIEDGRLATKNFGTMLYGLDQSYLLMRQLLETDSPDLIVFGLTMGSIHALGNRFIPLRQRSESNMPFFKPRFVQDGVEVTLIPPPPLAAYEDALGEAKILRELAATDDFYCTFAQYRRFGFLPLSNSLWEGARKARTAWNMVTGEKSSSPLFFAILDCIEREAAAANVEVVFLLLPTRTAAQPSRIWQLFPDRYAELGVELGKVGLSVVDARDALLASGRPLGELFYSDDVHYTRRGNEVIAAGLAVFIAEIFEQRPRPQ